MDKIFPKYPGEQPKRRYDKPSVRNLLGQKFNKLTVVEYVGQRRLSGKWTSYWIAQCDCGSDPYEIRGCYLINNHTKSCGCLLKETMAKKRGKDYIKDISGFKFGRLTPIKYSHSDKRWRAMWECKCDCGKIFIARGSDITSGRIRSCGCIRGSLDFVDYDRHAEKLVIDKTRRDPENRLVLQVKCYKCGKWFTPTMMEFKTRTFGADSGLGNFYCSNKCKSQCSVFGKVLYPDGFKPQKREDFPKEVKVLVLKKDDHTCQKCGAKEKLECHHIKSYNREPLLAADIDNIITLCYQCHLKTHSQDGCTYNDMKCN